MSSSITVAQVLGQTDSHLVFAPEFACWVHPDVVAALGGLSVLAKNAGYELAVASSFRSFERQREIWNSKAEGQRAVLDDDEQEIDITGLDDWSLIQSILRWSALPGASRHHWGTDFDVYDKAAVPSDYKLQLTAAETQVGGPFAKFHHWLSEQIDNNTAYGFVRPYAVDKGGVGCEPWHISYKPIASQFESALNIDVLTAALRKADLRLGDALLNNLPEIHRRYISANVA